MKNLIFKLEQIYGLREKYLNNVTSLFVSYSSYQFNALKQLEKMEYADDLRIKIESVGEITIGNIHTYFNSLFNANSSANYYLIIKKIREVLEKYKVKLNIENDTSNETKLDYSKLESHILKSISDFINSFNIPYAFNYKLIFNGVTKEEDEKDKDVKTPFVGVEYLNIEQIPVLLDKVIKYLPLFNTLIDLHGLLSIQQIDFSVSQYNAIRDCFVKVKNSKLTRIDINDIIQKLDKSNNDDIFDILSEEYITFAATLLECSYFLCDYLINFTSNQNKPKKVKHKNELELISHIEDNINIYMDQISFIEDIDPIDLYINVHNKLATINEEELLKELSKNK